MYSEEDRMRLLYLQEIEDAKLTDKELVRCLIEVMEMGYYNYRVNYNLLTRNKKDINAVIEHLCNNDISESMV